MFDTSPEGVELGVGETARLLGLGERGGRSSPLFRCLARLVAFDLASTDPTAEADDSQLAVRRYVPPINRRHVRRLPEALQREHDQWTAARLAEQPLAAARLNARRLAAVLTELGGSLDEVERALGAHGFHPAICWESAVYARERLAAQPAATLSVPATPTQALTA